MEQSNTKRMKLDPTNEQYDEDAALQEAIRNSQLSAQEQNVESSDGMILYEKQ